MSEVPTEQVEQIKRGLAEDTERLKSREGYLYAGVPCFKGVYGRDALIASWQLLKHDAGIAMRTLRFLATHQGKRVDPRREEEPGKILHVYDYAPFSLPHRLTKGVQRLTQGLPYYGSIDSTPLFVIVAGEYSRATGDMALISELWPNIERAVSWISAYGDLDGDGFVEYRRRNPFGLRNQNWKDGIGYLAIKAPVAPVEVEGYAYAAYEAAVNLARVLDKGSADWAKRAAELKAKFNERFWMPGLDFFALALDGGKRQVREIASNAGHLIFTGILDRGRQDRVVARLFLPDMFTEYGIRTHSSSSRYFRKSHLSGAIWPHDNWMVWIGLRSCGYAEEAGRIRAGLLKAYAKLGCIPEFYDVVDGGLVAAARSWHGIRVGQACCPQAWASGALLNMLEW